MLKSPLKTIRLYCLSCSGTSQAVQKCPNKNTCVLWSYRTGHDPRRAPRILTFEQRQAMQKRMQAASKAGKGQVMPPGDVGSEGPII